MNGFFRFEYAWLLYVLVPVVIIGIVARYWFHRNPSFSYALVGEMKKKLSRAGNYYTYVLFALRSVVFLVLVFLIAKPQLVDYKSELPVQGIDIILVLDETNSMGLPLDHEFLGICHEVI